MTENQPAGDGETDLSNECKELLSLPKGGWISLHQHQYQGFWCPTEIFQGIIAFQKHFQARDADIVVASVPKSGATWLKALIFAIVNQQRFKIKIHPLLTSNSHNLVPFLEVDLYINNLVPDFSSKFPEPRLFATHIPFLLWVQLKCPIVRSFMFAETHSTHLFLFGISVTKSVTNSQSLAPLSLDEAFDMYCQGVHVYGPFWDHMLGYWKESLKRPNNVLFLKYEDMKKDGVYHLKTLAKFLDCPFTEEEERNGVIEDIAKLCSFETMKKLEINKTGTFVLNMEGKNLFRKAEVGDWVNYLTTMMEQRMSKVIEEKLGSPGLTFKGTPELADHVQQN